MGFIKQGLQKENIKVKNKINIRLDIYYLSLSKVPV